MGVHLQNVFMVRQVCSFQHIILSFPPSSFLIFQGYYLSAFSLVPILLSSQWLTAGRHRELPPEASSLETLHNTAYYLVTWNVGIMAHVSNIPFFHLFTPGTQAMETYLRSLFPTLPQQCAGKQSSPSPDCSWDSWHWCAVNLSARLQSSAQPCTHPPRKALNVVRKKQHTLRGIEFGDVLVGHQYPPWKSEEESSGEDTPDAMIVLGWGLKPSLLMLSRRPP